MKAALCSLVVFCAFTLAAWAGDFSGQSPSGKVSFGSKDSKEFYIWSTANPAKRVLIYKEEVVFVQAAAMSPDDVWIALEQGGASLGHTLLFFKRQSGLEYKQVGGADNDADPAQLVGSFALQSRGIKENILDHTYLHPVKWSDDSMWLTVAMDAKGSLGGGKIVEFKDWRCRYNPVTHAITAVAKE